ncbi:class IIb bacteriocin, lactobin A/cerein 7B family [Aquimarina sp. D1M17]|uniref:class IIb bacteriocin, lactobin A/cerein 7B family n=1 Tax=Aquimarina acroporae TaxID=2937283 RepID=UPI0020C00800|nr:class IIb bacteriocin, lactobin A/cerein 7B family [Aquimarina acroporae]MCK8524166.1 class IIb bacteriocin, lactobin A/cerein 7B family [Aquimarina acroporae]
MRDLKFKEIEVVSGGPVVFAIPAAVKAVAAVGALVGGAITGGHAVGKVIGETAQRMHEAKN